MSAEFLERVASLPNERSVEIPWLLETCTVFPALDVGSTESIYITSLAGPVDGIDLRPTRERRGCRQAFVGDIRTWRAPDKYPTVLAISTIEHIGLACEPYGTARDAPERGDRVAVEGCMANLADDGVLLLTVPFGDRFEDRGWYRVYDTDALDVLLAGYDCITRTERNPEWEVGGVALVEVRHGH